MPRRTPALSTLRCRWIPPEPVERYRGAYYHALKADPCAYCGEPAGSIDHIDPSSRGGTNEHDNLTGACSSCNSSKHRKPLLRHMLLRLIARDLDPLLAEYAAAGDLENIPQSHEEAASQHQDGVGLCSTGLAVWGRCDGGVRARKILLSFLLHQLFFGGARVGDSRDVARS